MGLHCMSDDRDLVTIDARKHSRETIQMVREMLNPNQCLGIITGQDLFGTPNTVNVSENWQSKITRN